MEELRKEAYGPAGDALRHVPFDDLAAGLRALADAPKDVGVLALVVRRLADGARETPARLRLTPEGACQATAGAGARRGRSTRSWRSCATTSRR